MTTKLLKNSESKFLKLLAKELLLNELDEIDKLVSSVSQRTRVPKKEIERFMSFLYRQGLLVKYENGQKYAITTKGIIFLLTLYEPKPSRIMISPRNKEVAIFLNLKGDESGVGQS
jgi:predicted transcriptional regulator